VTADIVVFGYGRLTSSIIEELLKKNYSIICVSDSFRDQELFHSKRIKSISYKDAMNSTITSTITIFAWRDRGIADKFATFLFDWLESSNFATKKSFFLSSASVYEDCMVANNELCTNLENNEKLSLEKSLAEVFVKKKIIHTNLRISNVYGLGLDYGFIGSIFKSIQYGNTIGVHPNLNTSRDYIHVQDVVYAIEALIKIDTGKLCINISTGIGTTISQVLDIFAKKGYKLENRKEIVLNSKSKKVSILDCTTLSKLIHWAPSTLATTIDKLIPNY
jgi:nucleoside-diphosphate-sugar epimerase